MKTRLDEQKEDSLWICHQQRGCDKYIKQKNKNWKGVGKRLRK